MHDNAVITAYWNRAGTAGDQQPVLEAVSLGAMATLGVPCRLVEPGDRFIRRAEADDVEISRVMSIPTQRAAAFGLRCRAGDRITVRIEGEAEGKTYEIHDLRRGGSAAIVNGAGGSGGARQPHRAERVTVMLKEAG